MPQQPSATIAGQMRLSGPRTLGDKNGRLEERTPLVVAGLPLFPLLFTVVETLCVLLPTDPFLRFLVLGIALTHLHCACLLIYFSLLLFCLHISA